MFILFLIGENNSVIWNVKKENVIKELSFQLAIDVLELYQLLNQNKQYVIPKQLLRSGTSIGANVYESQYAESLADFIHKMHITLR